MTERAKPFILIEEPPVRLASTRQRLAESTLFNVVALSSCLQGGRDTVQPIPINDLVCRAWAEFGEMPGLKLSVAQARRLWNLDESVCHRILEVLVDMQLLRRTAGSLYVRRDEA